MENSKLLNLKASCRLCMIKIEEDEMVEIFTGTVFPESDWKNYSDYCTQQTIKDFTTIKVSQDDGLPQNVCPKCKDTLGLMFEFRKNCLLSQSMLLKNLVEIEAEMKPKPSKLDPVESQDLTTIKKENLKPIETKKRNRLPKCISVTKSIKDIGKNLSRIQDKKQLEDPVKIDEYQIMQQNQIKSKEKSCCEICGILTTELTYHMNVHNGLRPFVCVDENCDKTFLSPTQMRKHHRIMHSDYFPYKCNVCGKRFKIHTSFKFHQSYHVDPQIPCKICGKLLRNSRSVKRHMMTHTGERPYPCQQCSKSFQNNHTLKVHMRVHTKERPYICSKCGESFGYNCMLKAHTLKNHKESST